MAPEQHLLWALEVAFAFIADDGPRLDLPPALQQALGLAETTENSSLQGAPPSGQDPARRPSGEPDLDAVLEQWGVRTGRQLQAVAVRFGATMAALSLAYARQVRDGLIPREAALSPALLIACGTEIDSGLWAELVP
ncbi:MAG: hypothetical protein ABI807_06805 [Sporichthyaceae bacterium]